MDDNRGLILGIEIGSTKIKGVVIDTKGDIVTSQSVSWKAHFNEYWTYDLDEMWQKIQELYGIIIKNLKRSNVRNFDSFKSIGISGMMHGLLAFDKKGELLTDFRTWQNTNTNDAVQLLNQLLEFNIPHRWSIAHLIQAIMDEEEFVTDLDYITTLSGYVHWKLTGEKVLGINDASGMFPIDNHIFTYDEEMIVKVNKLIHDYGYNLDLEQILPKVQVAGKVSGNLLNQSVKLLDRSCGLGAGIPFAAPEGDAATGMVATNSVKPKTGNLSAGTSLFLMIVLQDKLKNYYPEVDVVMTPNGDPVAMIHANNFTQELNVWIKIFHEVLDLYNIPQSEDLYEKLFKLLGNFSFEELKGIYISNYHAGEPLTKIDYGKPAIVREPDKTFGLRKLIGGLVTSSLASLAYGLNALEIEGIEYTHIIGHGGFFKTELIGQEFVANILDATVSVNNQASEGGAWGMAILALYLDHEKKFTLDEFLDTVVFSYNEIISVEPKASEVAAFNNYITNNFSKTLELEKNFSKVI